MPFRRSRVRMIRLSSHWLVPADSQSKNSLLRTYCSSQSATPLFHAGQHADRRLYRWPLPVSADLRRRSRLPEARVAQLVEQRIENPRVGGSNPPPGTTFPYDTHVNSLLSRAFRCVTAWVVCSWVTVEWYNMCTKEAQPTTSSGVSLRMSSGTTSRREWSFV